MSKKYDWFAASLFQKDMSADDFYAIGITPDNTEIKSKDNYKNLPDVIDAFTNSDGKFDDNAFETFYNNALSSYNTYANSEYEKKVLQNYQWDPDNWMAPIGAPTRDVSARYSLNEYNKVGAESSIEAWNITSNGLNLSAREQGQMSEVVDADGNGLGYTPNERGGLFKALSRPTLVLDTYEEDTVEIIDGREIKHLKGEYKRNKYGLAQYRELKPGEDIYGKDVLHYSDTFTVDGSKLNKYDFFDSDGLDKSMGGTIAKTVAKTIPYFIPGVRWVWGAINAAIEIAQLMPTIAKAVNAIPDNEGDAQWLNNWESYLERFEGSVSDYSRDKMVTFENFGNLVADISGQLWQQRVVSQIPRLLKDAGMLTDGIKVSKAGEKLALAYMAGTSSAETYKSFKEAGADDRTAGIAMLANMFALYGLMNHDYFKRAIFRGGWLDENSVKRPSWEVAKKMQKTLGTEKLPEDPKTLFGKISNHFSEQLIPALNKSDFMRASFSEGIEETMEEVTVDLIKGVTEGLNALGVNVATNNELNFGWSMQDIASRYAMSFVGGTIGGAMFQANNKWEQRNLPEAVKQFNKDDLAKFTYLIAEGRADEIKAYYKKLYDKGLLGDSNLSASKVSTTVNLDGVDETIAESAEKGQSQNDIVYRALIQQVDFIEKTLADEKFKFPESVLIDMVNKGIRPEEDMPLLRSQVLHLAGVNSSMLNEWNHLATDIVEIKSALEAKYNNDVRSAKDSDKQATLDIFNQSEEVLRWNEDLKRLRARRDQILNGELNWYYVPQGLFVLDEDTNKWFVDMDKDKFAQLKHHKTYASMTTDEKGDLDKEYNEYQRTEGKQNLYRAYDVYLKLSELSYETLANAAVSLQSLENDTIHNGKTGLETYAEKVRQYNDIVKQLAKYAEESQNRTLTADELDKVIKLNESKETLNNDIKQLANSTSTLLRGNTENEKDLPKFNISEDSLVAVKQYLTNLYTNFAASKQIMRSEDELEAFYRMLKTTGNNAESLKDRLSTFMTIWWENPFYIDNLESGDPDEINTQSIQLFTQETDTSVSLTPLQQQLVNLLQEIEDNIGSGNIEQMQQKYDEAKEFIKSNSKVNDTQADMMLRSILMKVGDQNIIEVEQDIANLRNNITFSPIFDILKQFRASYSEGTLNIEDMLNGEIHNLINSNNIDDYVISSQQVVDELKQTYKLLNTIKALINGSFSGLNQTANKLRGNNYAPLLELDGKTAKLLGNDIDVINKRISHLLDIASRNGKKKLTIHKDTEMKMKPLVIKCFIDENFVKDFKNKTTDAEYAIDIKEIWDAVNKDLKLNLDKVDDSNWKQFESARIQFETLLGNELKKLKDVPRTLINCFGDDVYKTLTTKISPDTDAITSYDLMLYMLDLAAINSDAFYTRYNNVLQKMTLAPVYGQELAVRRNISMSANKDWYNVILSELQNKYPEGVSKKKPLSNVSVTLGGAGTGKTVAVSAISAEMLSFDNDIEFVYIASNTSQVNKLQKSVGKEGTLWTAKSFNEFFEKEPVFEEIRDEKNQKTGDHRWNYSLNAKKIWNGGKSRKVMIVDEATLLDAARWQALSELAERQNGIIWALGDDKQNAANVRVTENGEFRKDWEIGIDELSMIKAPTLTTAMRPSTVGKYDNGLMLDVIISKVNSEATDRNAETKGDYNKITTEIVDQLKFKHYEDALGVCGEKFIDADKVGHYLEKLSKLGSVAYITDKKDIGDIKGVEIIKLTEDKNGAQGGEWDYVIIDKQWSKEPYDAIRDLYTVSQRSVKGSVIVYNHINDILPVIPFETVTAKEPMQLSNADLNNFVTWKKNSLSVSDVETEFINLFKNTELPNNLGNEKEEIKQIIIEEQKKQAEVPAVAVVNNKAEEIQSGKETENPDNAIKPQQLINESQPKQLETPKEEKKLPPVNGTEVNELRFFEEVLFNDTYWNSHAFVNIFTLTLDEAKELGFMLSSAVKANAKITSRDLTGIVNVDKFDSIKKFIDNSKVHFELHAEPYGTNSTLITGNYINDGTKESFSFPVTVIEGQIRSGIYNGEFTLIDKVRYNRGEDIPLSSLKVKYPWLRIFNEPQVISVDPKVIKTDTTFNERTINYTLDNNGKAMILASDNPFLMRGNNGQSAYSITPYGDTNWTHKNPKNFTNFGLIRKTNLSDIIQFSMLWSEKLKIINDPIAITIAGDRNAWMRDKIGINALPTDDFGNRRYQILSSDNCGRLLAKLMNEACNRNPNDVLPWVIKWSFNSYLQKEDPKGKDFYRNGLRFKAGDNWYYMEFSSPNGYNLYEYSPNTFIVGNKINNTPFETENGGFPFTKVRELGEITWLEICGRKFDSNGNVTGNPFPQFISNQITQMLSGVNQLDQSKIVYWYGELDKVLLNDNYFLNGKIFTNVAGEDSVNPFLPNKVSRRFVGNLNNYSTDASIWTPSRYSIDLNAIQNISKNNARIDFENSINEIIKLVNGYDISSIVNTTSKVSSDYDNALSVFINRVNDVLKVNSNDWNYKQIVKTDTGEFVLINESDVISWLKEKTGAENVMDVNFNRLDSLNFGIFYVSLSDNSEKYISVNKVGENWVINDFESYDSFADLNDYWIEHKSELQQLLPNFERYLKETFDTTNKYGREISEALRNPLLGDFKQLVSSYLLERIANNEC